VVTKMPIAGAAHMATFGVLAGLAIGLTVQALARRHERGDGGPAAASS